MNSAATDPRHAQILDERAKRLARIDASERDRCVVDQVVVFSVGQERLGISARELRSIVRVPPIVPLARLPDWMPGITHARGEIISVVDLGRWLGIAAADAPECLAIVEGEPGAIGLLTDTVSGFRDIYEDEIAEDLGSQSGRPVRSVTKDLITILDLNRLFGDEQWAVPTKP